MGGGTHWISIVEVCEERWKRRGRKLKRYWDTKGGWKFVVFGAWSGKETHGGWTQIISFKVWVGGGGNIVRPKGLTVDLAG